MSKNNALAEDESIEQTGEEELQKNRVERAKEIEKKLIELRNIIDIKYYEIAGYLFEMWNSALYRDLGYVSFKDFVENKIGFKDRKARYLINIYQWIEIDAGFNAKDARDIALKQRLIMAGWSKAKELVGVITRSNADEWVAKAETLTVEELKIAAHNYLQAARNYNPDSELGSDQSVSESGGGNVAEDTSNALEHKSFYLYPEQAANVDLAITRAKTISKSDAEGHNLDLICTNFLAMNPASDDPETFVKILFNRIEADLGYKVIVFDNKFELCYGDSNVDQLTAIMSKKIGDDKKKK